MEKGMDKMNTLEQNSYILGILQMIESSSHSFRLYCLTSYSVLTALGVLFFFRMLDSPVFNYALFISFILLMISSVLVLIISLALVRKASTDGDFFYFSLIKNEYNFRDPKTWYFNRFLEYRVYFHPTISASNLLSFKKNDAGLDPYIKVTGKRIKDEEIKNYLLSQNPFRALYLGNYLMVLLLAGWFIMLAIIIYISPLPHTIYTYYSS